MKSAMRNSIEEKDAETVAEVFIRADMRGRARITRSQLKMSKTLEEDWVLDKEGKPTIAAE